MKKIHDIQGVLKADYSALYLTKTKNILLKNKVKHNTIMRFCHFGKEPIKVCGIEHVVQVLKSIKGKKNFKVYGLKDGQAAKAGQPILIIKGDYSAFAEYESFIDGILARESSVCTNAAKVLSLIKPDQLIYMGDRGDLYIAHAYDGYGAYKAGVRIFTTKAQAALIDDKNVKVVGTIPHALIQQFKGNLSKALWAYHRTYPKEKLSALVDYHNDVVNEIKHIDKGLRPLLKSIRIDTSASLLDKSLSNKKDKGVSAALVFKARKALDANGMKHVKIVVSSGFDYKKIKEFKNKKVPVDFYGIGGSLLKVNVNITGDLVYLDNKPQAKVGRKLGIDPKNIKKLNIYI